MVNAFEEIKYVIKLYVLFFFQSRDKSYYYDEISLVVIKIYFRISKQNFLHDVTTQAEHL